MTYNLLFAKCFRDSLLIVRRIF